MGKFLKSRLFRVAAVVLLLAGLYALLGFYAAPRIVRSQALDFVREKYGRELTLGEIRINPFKLQAEIKDLSLPDTDGKPMLAFRRFFVDFELSSLWHRAYVFKDVQLDAPLARTVIRPDGSVNLADLALPDEEDKEDEDESLPALWIQHFALGDGTAQFADLARRVPLNGSSRRSTSSSTTSRPRRKAVPLDSPRKPRTRSCWSGAASSHSPRRSLRRATSRSPG